MNCGSAELTGYVLPGAVALRSAEVLTGFCPSLSLACNTSHSLIYIDDIALFHPQIKVRQHPRGCLLAHARALEVACIKWYGIPQSLRVANSTLAEGPGRHQTLEGRQSHWDSSAAISRNSGH